MEARLNGVYTVYTHTMIALGGVTLNYITLKVCMSVEEVNFPEDLCILNL